MERPVGAAGRRGSSMGTQGVYGAAVLPRFGRSGAVYAVATLAAVAGFSCAAEATAAAGVRRPTGTDCANAWNKTGPAEQRTIIGSLGVRRAIVAAVSARSSAASPGVRGYDCL